MAIVSVDGDHEVLAVRDIETLIRIGVADQEKIAAQRVVVAVEMQRQIGPGAPSQLAECMDYSRIVREITEAWPTLPHDALIESWAERLIVFVLEDPRVEVVRVILEKPDIFPGSAAPRIERTRFRRA